MNKTNGKSTTDIKNEMLKRPGESMTRFIYPMIKAVWEEEEVPKVWNRGRITSIWKGKGDKELLKNHRGITTSSAIALWAENTDSRDKKKIACGLERFNLLI